MELRWKHLAIALTIFPVAIIVFAWIGFFNIGASTGHWKVTEWLLHSAMRTAVKTYALLEVDAPAQLPRHDIGPAAGHFARGCAICHGAPGELVSPSAQRMLPPPPDLTEKVGEWNDAELFWIVKYGVRFTGMPAWPTQARDDEVWAMVAFLRELPGMSAQSYRALSLGQSGRLEISPRGFANAIAECSRCHGRDGLKAGGLVPIIAGQKEGYLLASLRSYADRERRSGIMALPISALDPAVFPDVARHFSRQPSRLRQIMPDEDDRSDGARIVFGGAPDRAIPSCFGCHGNTAIRNETYPDIAGQDEHYIANQLRLFRAAARGGGQNAHLMHKSAERLSDADINALAAFLGALAAKNATPTAAQR
ncbi:c-type cytochrome [Aminobacter aganoensis]|uniref:Cytochrome c553 n=1 Tax=Aminobacter aganoensis TaxID=83264 RepID=A0A7X0KP03_9HYPH|nr:MULTISPECIES: c-type cytochrome [Aminobacter]MBB6357703.1 cytochrome c553 [Aminobacter aganoensis]